MEEIFFSTVGWDLWKNEQLIQEAGRAAVSAAHCDWLLIGAVEHWSLPELMSETEAKKFSPDRPVYIHGFTLAGYRSFGERQYISPLGKINLFIGPNNSGKSNILKFVWKHWGNFI